MINPPSARHMDSLSQLGRTAWFDLPCKNLSDAMSFYEGLLGWTYRQMENSPEKDYVLIEAAGELIGGLRASPPSPLPVGEGGPPKAVGEVILYFTVDDLAAKVTRAKELGATLIGSPVELGRERGRYQWIRDREGNLIGLWAPQ
jgi:predicted enzyme related to lactoylglutathione lyase